MKKLSLQFSILEFDCDVFLKLREELSRAELSYRKRVAKRGKDGEKENIMTEIDKAGTGTGIEREKTVPTSRKRKKTKKKKKKKTRGERERERERGRGKAYVCMYVCVCVV